MHKGKQKPVTKAVKSAATAAALKAERERDKAQALQNHEDEQRACQANMARLRGLRLAKERAEAKKVATAPQTGSAWKASS